MTDEACTAAHDDLAAGLAEIRAELARLHDRLDTYEHALPSRWRSRIGNALGKEARDGDHATSRARNPTPGTAVGVGPTGAPIDRRTGYLGRHPGH